MKPNTVFEGNDLSSDSMNVHEGSILNAFKGKKRRNEKVKLRSERKKLNDDDLSAKYDKSSLDSKNIKVSPKKNSYLTTTAKDTEVKSDVVSNLSDGISSEALNNSNSLGKKIVIPALENRKESRPCASDKETVKPTLKRKRVETTDRVTRSMKYPKMVRENNTFAVEENSTDNEALKDEKPKFNQKLDENNFDWASILDINIPLTARIIIMPNRNDKPFTKRYDLAILRNKRRFRHQRETGEYIPKISCKEWKKQQNNRSEEETAKDAAKKQYFDLSVALYMTKITVKILKLLQSKKVDEKRIAQLFIQFLRCRVRPASLLHIPYFVHAMMFCRGEKKFSRQLRSIANRCFYKCRAMFPVPAGYNFETVYTFAVRKFNPDAHHMFDNMKLDYGDFSDPDMSD